MIHGHGGNIYALARQLGCDPFDIADMSSNVNPLGPPPALLAHLQRHLHRIQALPEADAGRMVQRFADAWGIPADEVLAGNGTTQIIHDLPRALDLQRALIMGPTYADYADACRVHGTACRFILAREADDFQPDWDGLREALPAHDALYLCNPNNPTGQLVPAAELRELCRAHPDKLFVVDESYLPFVPGHEDHSLIRARPDNALVLHSMSKIFRIPGLRVGFVVGAAPLIARLGRFALPWAVNSLAQAAVDYLLTHNDASAAFIRETQAFVSGARVEMVRRLSAIPGLQLFPSRTSFFVLKLPAFRPAADVCRYLQDRRVLIRNCANFEGLSERFVRISIKTEATNRRCAALLADCLAETRAGQLRPPLISR